MRRKYVKRIEDLEKQNRSLERIIEDELSKQLVGKKASYVRNGKTEKFKIKSVMIWNGDVRILGGRRDFIYGWSISVEKSKCIIL